MMAIMFEYSDLGAVAAGAALRVGVLLGAGVVEVGTVLLEAVGAIDDEPVGAMAGPAEAELTEEENAGLASPEAGVSETQLDCKADDQQSAPTWSL
jgi:hypothetical protein